MATSGSRQRQGIRCPVPKEQREAVQQKENTAKLQMGSSKNFNSKLYIQHKLKQLLHGMKVSIPLL